MEKVKLDVRNGQGWITIQRPEKRNAIDYDVIHLLNENLEIAANQDDIKIIIITGEGNEAFCSGGDLSVFHSIYTKADAKKMLLEMARVLHKLFFFPKPTVAYVNGTAVGGGCELATACDFRVAKKDVTLGFIQGKLGITTGWGGSTYLFERMNRQSAFQLLLSANTFPASLGVKHGFIEDLLDGKSFEEWLSNYTKHPLGVLLAYKQRFLAKYDEKEMFQRVLNEIEDCSTLWETPEHHEAVARFIRK